MNSNTAKKTTQSTKNQTPIKVLIDADAGIDDAWALFLATAASSSNPNFQIVGITTGCGNTTVDYVTNNVTRIMDTVFNNSIPIFRGMESFLLNAFHYTEDPPYFGEDGFGDADLPEIPTRTEAEHSIQAIIRLAQEHQGELSMICLGPLTNLAMAVKQEPRLRNWLKDIFILGGNIEGMGNVGENNNSEFNFFVDPEAAKIVLDNFDGVPIILLPWEPQLKYATSTYEFRTVTLRNLGTPIIELMDLVEATLLENNQETWMASDAILMSCFINPAVIVREETHHCDIETGRGITRGMMILDRLPNSSKPKNVRVIMELDLSLIEPMLVWAAGGPPP